MDWTSRAVNYTLTLIGLLALVGCGIARPNRAKLPTPTLTLPAMANPEPTSIANKTRPPSDAGPTPPPTARAVDPPTYDPETTSTMPKHQPTIPYDQALRSAFQSDDDQFPNATRYQLDLTLDLKEAMLFGHQQVGYTNTEIIPLDALYLRLLPNTPGYGGEMTVNKLMLDNEPVEPARELQGSALRIPLHPALAPGMRLDLSLDFRVVLPTAGDAVNGLRASDGYRQLGIYEGVVALANAYPMIPVYDDEGWNVELAPSYGDATFSDTAFFDVSITTPQTMTLAASGACTATKMGALETTWSCAAALMRDFNIVLGKAYQVKSHDVGGITVNSVFRVEDGEGGAAALDYASRAIRLFNARIGPYPFTELDVVETPTLAGGIEYPGLVVINESYYGSKEGVGDRMEWVVVHEVLHQWWYSLVHNDQVDEPWLDEALVQYCTLLYYEEQYGQAVAERLLESVFQQTYQELQETGRDQPVGLPVGDYSRSNYGPVVYQKGPLYFHNLRQQVGSETFWKILATYFERHRYRITRPEDWLGAVRAVTGSEYRSLYDQWIREMGS